MEAVSVVGAYQLRSKFNLITVVIVKELHSEQSLNPLLVNIGNESDVGQISLLLLGLLCENVALKSMLSLHFSRSGKRETLF